MGSYTVRAAMKKKKKMLTKANKENKLTRERTWNSVKEANSSSEDYIFAYL